MRHLKSGKKLSRDRRQRKALYRTMLGSLIMRGKITTTEAKAKEIKGRIDKIITKAKKTKDPKRKVSIIRDLKNDIPVMATNKIVGEFLESFKKRSSGYSRIIKLAPRKSDGARMAVIELITE